MPYNDKGTERNNLLGACLVLSVVAEIAIAGKGPIPILKVNVSSQPLGIYIPENSVGYTAEYVH